jgi:hypothetical protein
MKCQKANRVDLKNAAINFSFRQQNNQQLKNINHEIIPPFHLHENSFINVTNAAETAIQIIAAKKPVTNPALCRYLHEKRINKNVPVIHLFEVDFGIEKGNEFSIVSGFKNSAVGFKLRYEFSCLNSTRKYFFCTLTSTAKNGAKKPPIKSILDDETASQNDAEKMDPGSVISDKNYTRNKESKTRKPLPCLMTFLTS